MKDQTKNKLGFFGKLYAFQKSDRKLNQARLDDSYKQENLLHAEEESLSPFESIYEGRYRVSPAGRYLAANYVAARQLGYESPEELIEKVTDIGTQVYVNPEDRRKLTELLKKDGFFYDVEAQFRQKNGNIVWHLVSARAVFDNHGNILYHEGSCKDITQLKQTQLLLKDAEEKYRTIANFTSDWESWLDADGKLIWVSPSVYSHVGYSVNECMAMPNYPFPLIYPEDQGRLYEVMQKVNEQPFRNLEFRVIRKDGKLIWVAASTTPVHTETGGNLGHRASVRDISKIREAEETLKQSEIKYRQLYESMMDGYVSGDFNGYAIDANEPFLKMLGYSPEELRKLNYKDITPEKWHVVDKHVVKKMLLTRGHSDVFEKEYIRKDGTIFPVELRTSVLKDAKGTPIGFWSIVRDITERKKSEEELRLSEIKYRDLHESMMDGYTSIDMQGHIIDFNKTFINMLGYSAEELRKLNFRDFTPKKWKILEETIIQKQLISRGYSDVYEKEYIRKDGTILPVELRAVLLKNDIGKPVKMWAIIRDISDRKKAEKELKISEENYRSLFDNSPIGLYQVDPLSGRFIRANHVAAGILGYESPEELMESVTDMTSQVFVNPSDREMARGWLKKDGFFKDFEVQNRRKDGSIIWVLASVKAVREEQGNIVYHEGTSQDITELKRAREALRLSEKKYRRLHESVVDGFVSVNMQGYILDFNEAYLKMLGYTAEELSRLTYKDITPEKWHAMENEIVESQVLMNGHSTTYEKEYIRKDKTVFPVELRTVMLKDDEDEPMHMWAFVHDITKRKQEEEAIKKSEEAFRRIAEDATDFIALVDKNGIVQKILSNTKGAFGYEDDELKNINAMSLGHPDDVERISSLFGKGAVKDWRELVYPAKLRHRDGRYLDVEITVRRINDIKGKIIGNIFAGRLMVERQTINHQTMLDIHPQLTDRRLTNRENEILGWVMEGKSSWDISQIINISERTVKFHVDNIMKKLNAVNRTHAVAIFLHGQQVGLK